MNDKPEPVSLTVHRVDTPDAGDGIAPAARTALGRLKMLMVLLVCAAPVIASYVTYYWIRPQATSSYGTLIQPTRTLPALTLRELDGRVVPADSLRRQWLLLVVTRSACDAACEQLLFMQRQLREMLGRERERLDRVWLVADDGELGPELLRGVRSTPGLQVLRARREELLGWLQPAPGQALEDHLYVVDPHGEWMMRMPVQAEPAKVKRDLDRLLRASASWDLPGR
jgi:hypothetical protein